MINRTLVRTRVIQNLYAYYKDGEKTPLTARAELLKSFSSTYDLYFILLDLANELVTYAEGVVEEQRQRAKITHQTFTPNLKFIDNRFAKQLFNNRMLRNNLSNQHLSWDAGLSAVSALYKQLSETDFFREYMSNPEDSYLEDKKLWRNIYENLLPDNENVLSALEDMEITLDETNWTTDMNVVLSYVIKTVKQFKAESTPDQPLLQMFDSEEELHFGETLLLKSIASKDECDHLVSSNLRGWDSDRVATMDKILLQTAITELLYFDDIAIEVTLNEYLELAKEYSGDKSYIFINGILNEILHQLKNENKLLKALTIK